MKSLTSYIQEALKISGKSQIAKTKIDGSYVLNELKTYASLDYPLQKWITSGGLGFQNVYTNNKDNSIDIPRFVYDIEITYITDSNNPIFSAYLQNEDPKLILLSFSAGQKWDVIRNNYNLLWDILKYPNFKDFCDNELTSQAKKFICKYFDIL